LSGKIDEPMGEIKNDLINRDRKFKEFSAKVMNKEEVITQWSKIKTHNLNCIPVNEPFWQLIEKLYNGKPVFFS
jgi:hypothetical protein